MPGGVDRQPLPDLGHLAGQRLEARQPGHPVVLQLDAQAYLLVAGVDLHRVPPHPEGAPFESHVVPGVVDTHQPLHDLLAVDPLADVQDQHVLPPLVRRAQAVDAGHRGHDDHVPPLHQGRGGPQPQPLDVLVDVRVLLDVGVRCRQVGLGLVVVVVGDEELHRVLREEALELPVELGGQRLVVRDHQGRPVDPLDDVGHGEGLARAGDPQQHLVFGALVQAVDQGLDGLRLVAGGLVA